MNRISHSDANALFSCLCLWCNCTFYTLCWCCDSLRDKYLYVFWNSRLPIFNVKIIMWKVYTNAWTEWASPRSKSSREKLKTFHISVYVKTVLKDANDCQGDATGNFDPDPWVRMPFSDKLWNACAKKVLYYTGHLWVGLITRGARGIAASVWQRKKTSSRLTHNIFSPAPFFARWLRACVCSVLLTERCPLFHLDSCCLCRGHLSKAVLANCCHSEVCIPGQ